MSRLGPLRISLAYCAINGAVVLHAQPTGSRGSVAPPEAATEVWSPVPPVVNAPLGKPPADAIVLFDGTNLDAWQPVREHGLRWKIEDNAMVVVPSPQPCDQQTIRAFGDVQLHIEWRTPAQVRGEGQDRGNSGVFFIGLYELQVLDSFNNPTYVNGQAGAVYKEHAPLVNVSRRPGEWQTYDVVFIAPRFGGDGALLAPARMTVLLPMLSACVISPASTMVTISISSCGWVGNPVSGSTMSSLNTRKAPNWILRGSK